MSKGAINFSGNNEYYTPRYILNYFGSFEYDPATTDEQANYLNIKYYDTVETNGLLTDWTCFKSIWINPPFTNKIEFIEKAYNTYNQVKNEIYILLPIETLVSVKFHDITKNVGGKIYLPKRRIKFINEIGNKAKMPAFGTVIIKYKINGKLN